MYPDAPSYNTSKLAYNNDLSPKLAWLNLVQSYAIALEHELELAKTQVALIQPNYHPNAV
jgi:hypothetical protein